MGDAFYALDDTWRVVYANQHALAFWGLREEDIVGHVLWDRLPQLVGSVNETVLRRVSEERQAISFESRSPVTTTWVQVTVSPYAGGVAVYWRDISTHKEAEQTLRASEEHLRLAQDAAGIGAWDWDLITGRIRWSPQMLRLLGHDPVDLPADLYGLWVNALHPEDRERADATAREHSRSVAPFSQEFRIIRPDGEERWIISQGTVLPDEHGAPRRMLGVNIDITDRKRTEAALEYRVLERTRAFQATLAALQDSRARHRAIFEHAPVDLVFLRVLPDGSIACEDANPAWFRHAGYTREQTAESSLQQLFMPELTQFVEAHFRRAIETGQPVEYESATRLPAGEVVRRCFVVPLRDASGRVDSLLLTAVDLTDMRRMEAQLQQAQKMEAIGQLTGGVAHDFNNLLTAVTGNLELLLRRMGDERAERYARSALRAAQRGGELTQQLLAFARRQNLSPQSLDINAVLRGMAELLQRSLGGLVQVDMQLDPALWIARSDPTQLESMVLNLAINARDAMPDGGTIRIATRNLPEPQPELAAELGSGAYVVISVSDDGVGMAADIAERAFEPFFTTKDVGKGSGLGLAQVFGIAKQFGGSARLRSVPGRGTTVEVFLPRAEAAAEPGDSVGDDAEEAAGDGMVLVLDDEPAVRAVAVNFLQDAGYRVYEAADCVTALAMLDTEAIDLALVDYAMPGMSGIELVRQARARRPDLCVVYVSGDTGPLDAVRLEGEDGVLAKPYSAAALLGIVRTTLRRRSNR